MQYQFDSWDLATRPIDPRSRLYALEPIGIGTPQVESLTSYVARLAAAHAVRLGDLLRRELGTNIPSLPSIPNISAINGVGESAQRWVDTLQMLTSINDLRFLTVLPFAPLFPAARLLRAERAWCPECYEGLNRGQSVVYEPLLWCLKSVEVCIRHKRYLETICPACDRSQGYTAATLQPGFCSHCQQCLGDTGHRSPRDVDRRPTQYQYWITEEFGNLLALAPHAESKIANNNISKVLNSYVQAFADGNRLAVSEIGGCRCTTFFRWCTKPSITKRVDILLQVCRELKISLTSLAIGRPPETDGVDGNQRSARIAERRTPRGIRLNRSPQYIREALQRALQNDSAPSLYEVALDLGYSTTSQLYEADPGLCRQVTLNFRRFRRSRWWQKPSPKPRYKPSYLKKILEDALALDMPTPVNQLAAALGYLSKQPFLRFPKLCRAIAIKRAKKKQSFVSAMPRELKAALSANPTPSLTEVAKRIGCSPGWLRLREAELCKKLSDRRKSSKEQLLAELKTELSGILQHEPPPSLREVYRRLGTTREILRTYFPSISNAIAARHRRHGSPPTINPRAASMLKAARKTAIR